MVTEAVIKHFGWKKMYRTLQRANDRNDGRTKAPWEGYQPVKLQICRN